MNNIKNKRILTVAAAARYSGYSRATIEYWLSIGELKCERPKGRGQGNYRFRRIRKEDLDDLLNKSYGLEKNNHQNQALNDEMTLLPKKNRNIERRVDL